MVLLSDVDSELVIYYYLRLVSAKIREHGCQHYYIQYTAAANYILNVCSVKINFTICKSSIYIPVAKNRK